MNGHKHTSWSATASLVLGGTIVGLIVTEVVLRVALPPMTFQFPSYRMTDDRFAARASRTFDGRAIRYMFDADGFRVSDGSPDAAGETILFVGDSFTQGVGVQSGEAFPAVACHHLAQRNVRARCLNAGVSGFGTAHELRLLRALLQRTDLGIDAVVFQVLPNNDLRDNWEDGGFALDGERLVARDPPRIPTNVRLRDVLVDNEFARHSRIVTLAANAWFDGVGMDPRYDASAYALERHLLQEVVSTAQKYGNALVFLVTATNWELNRTTSHPYDDAERLDFVVATVQTLPAPWIDSRKVAAKLEHYIPDDGHFSVAGNALIGAALAEQLGALLE